MKNHSPLIQALKRRSKPDETPFRMPEPERVFHLQKEDIKPGQTLSPNDHVRVMLHGRVKSAHDDGSMMMAVHKVEHQMNEEKGEVTPDNEQKETHAVT